MDEKPELKWSDTVEINYSSPDGKTHQKRSITFDALRSRILNDPLGIQESRGNYYLTLTGLNALFLQLIRVPAGSIIKHMALKVLSPIITGGTTVNLALGQHAGTVNSYGVIGGLTEGNGFSKLLNPTVLGVETIIDLSGTIADGSALGDTNITDGQVFFSITLESPAQFN